MLLNPQFDDGLQDDFRRLGIRRFECRQVVIRNAASRQAATLALIVQNEPSADMASSKLSQVVTSTYRLLDPRRRMNYIERANVGRISEVELTELSSTQSAGQLFGQAAPDRAGLGNSAANVKHRKKTVGNRWSRIVYVLPRISRLG